MKALRLLALAAVIAAPCVARAADLPVSYTVDEKMLKLAIAGTNVTFDLYTDSACAGPIAHTETVAIENVDIISRLKLFKAKGALVKPPKTDELRHTLTGVAVTVSGALYLKVTGTGVSPLSGACQIQSAQVTRSDLPATTTTIRWGLTAASWGFENPTSVGLYDPTNIFAVDSVTFGVLATLDKNTRYSCSLQISHESSFPAGAGAYVPVSGMDCTAVPTCSDGLKNGNETAVDCGGGTCPPCASGQACLINSDCTSNVCSGSVCQP